jgi:hypothetical protein
MIKVAALSFMLLTVTALAEPPPRDPCQEAVDLAEHITSLQAVFDAISRAATPVCKVKDKPRCRRMLAELEDILELQREANAERHEAIAACEARKKEKSKK